MISQVNGAALNSAYQTSGQTKGVSQKSAGNISAQGDTSKIDQIKEALDAGEYKINIDALSKKIAEELV